MPDRGGLQEPPHDHLGERAALHLCAVADRPERLRPGLQDIARCHQPVVLHGAYHRPLHVVPGEPARVRSDPAPQPRHADGDAFVAELDRIVRANFTNDYWEITLPNRLDTSSPRSPALFAYLAALNLLDAELLFSACGSRTSSIRHRRRHARSSGTTCSRRPSWRPAGSPTPPGQRDREHGVPRLVRERSISDSAPTDYWPVMSERTDPNAEAPDRPARPAGRLGAVGLRDVPGPKAALIARVVQDGFATLWGQSSPLPRQPSQI